MVMQQPVRSIMLNSMLSHIDQSLWCSVVWGAGIMPADRIPVAVPTGAAMYRACCANHEDYQWIRSGYGRDPNGPAPPGTRRGKVVVVRTVTVLPFSIRLRSSFRTRLIPRRIFQTLIA